MLCFYTAAQLSGPISGVAIARYVLRTAPENDAIRFAITVSGVYGNAVAFAAELVISFILMITVLFVTNRETLTRYAPYFMGALHTTYITFETPLSGMSMNPARTFGSAFHLGYWHALWIYFIAPTSGMLVAFSEVFLRTRGGVGRYCAKLHHANNQRCILPNGHSIVRSYPAVEAVNSHDASVADVGNLEPTRTSRRRNETKRRA